MSKHTNALTLDSLRAKADENYSALPITIPSGTFELRNVLRLTTDERDELAGARKTEAEAEEAKEKQTQVEALQAQVLLLADDKALAQEFLDLVGDDLGILATVFAEYNEASQVGEA